MITAEGAWLIAAGVSLALLLGTILYDRLVSGRGKVQQETDIDALQHQNAVTFLRLLEVENLVKEYDRGRISNERVMEKADLTPSWRPSERLDHIKNGGSQLIPLYDLLYTRFNDDELRDLAFRTGIGSGVLVETSHSALARSLVEHAGRRGIVDDLVRIGQGIRPELVWPTNLPKNE